MNEPTFFKPHALSRAPIIREGWIERDLSMPVRDWSQYDVPTCERIESEHRCREDGALAGHAGAHP
jgi:hypothetical protein